MADKELNRKKTAKLYSVRTKMVLLFLVFVLPLNVLFIFTNYYATNLLREQAIYSNKNTLKIYSNNIDYVLNEIDSYLYSIIINNIDFSFIKNLKHDYQHIMSEFRLIRELRNNIVRFQFIDFFYLSYADNDSIFVKRGPVTYDELNNVRKNIGQFCQNNNAEIEWSLREISGEYYLFRNVVDGNVQIGALINVRNIFNLFQKPENYLDSHFAISSSDGYTINKIHGKRLLINPKEASIEISNKDIKRKYIVLSQKSQIADFSIIQLISEKDIIRNLSLSWRMAKFMSIALLFTLPFLLYILRKILLEPLEKISHVMKQLEKGDWNTKIKLYRTSYEFDQINRTFNRMTEEIKNAKDAVYEEQLNRQRIQLRNLQLQINPHFLLNCLNMLYSLAQTKDFKTIQELVMYLVKYFRYSFTNKDNFVAIYREIDFVRNYLNIQKMRFPSSFEAEIYIEPGLEDYKIPTLTIQNFVENSIKHAIEMDKKMKIAVKVTDICDDRIQIVIADTGKGMDKITLERIQKGDKIVKGQRECIGIWNSRERLYMLYGDRANFIIQSEPSKGTKIIIEIPKEVMKHYG